MELERLTENLNLVRERISRAALSSGRSASDVTLVAVTKRTPVEWARHLLNAGQHNLGENYPQELWTKADSLLDQVQIQWHLIGHLQSNKLKRTLPLVHMIHGVDSLRLLAAIADLMPLAQNLQSLCLQVNVSEEESKHGWTEQSILAEADAIAELVLHKSLPLTGFMTIAGWGTDCQTARPAFVRLRGLAESFKARTGIALNDLSMGMSGDFEAAIAEGATHVRVGSALFEGLESP
ncbi:MAG: YggS family pyridoxal phosphate-dependent enzyme [Planctomycetota bacterium]|nr:MAG: YggS family pyridoxal phosphate-dependent enzyme [Planctomycetota bacterium]